MRFKKGVWDISESRPRRQNDAAGTPIRTLVKVGIAAAQTRIPQAAGHLRAPSRNPPFKNPEIAAA